MHITHKIVIESVNTHALSLCTALVRFPLSEKEAILICSTLDLHLLTFTVSQPAQR